MRTHKLSTLLLSALAVLALSATGCKKKSDPAPQTECTKAPLDASCTAGSDCCSGACAIPTGSTSGTCVASLAQCRPLGDPCMSPGDCCALAGGGAAACNGSCIVPSPTCKALDATCSAPQECCKNSCEGGVCTQPTTVCKELTLACTVNSDCCSGYCNGSHACDTPAAPSCRDAKVGCSFDAQCCSGACGSTGTCIADGGMCAYPGESCGSDAQCCSHNCPNAGSAGATCSSAVCLQIDQTCASDTQCCSGVCGFGSKCVALPPGSSGSTCSTLGEACAVSSECCSTNCQGASGGLKNGTCMAVSACDAPGDICYRGEDCCSGLCGAPASPGDPGRCLDAPGGCGQDGYPCSADSNCCTKKCLDLGAGAKACQPSGGCRMNGDYCDGDASCCNVNFPPTPTSQYVHCDPAEHVCDNGGSCNPPGDICGYKASQNCCYGKQDVCKPDSAGIMRCFGGPPGCCTDAGCCPTCPTGWDAMDPQCCIQSDDICQFHDQCCGGAPCVPGADGILRCVPAPTQCLPSGATCVAGGSPACCTGATCLNVGEIGWVCATSTPPPVCLQPDATCTSGGTPCCVGACLGGTCTSCMPNGNSCTSGAQCCSTICDGGLCRAPCQGASGNCTVNSDCCSGLTCDIPAGATSGTCKGGVAPPTCANTDQSCTSLPCCDTTNTCTSGVCKGPVQCSEPLQTCTAGGNECCQGLQCYSLDAFETRIPCATGATCFCDAPSCAALSAPCSTLVPCCTGYCGENTSGLTCTSTDPSLCSCKPVG